MTATLPERVILDLLNLGVTTISATPTVLDSILEYLDATERAKARTYWASHHPTVVQGYARTGTPFPCFALALLSDTTNQDYLGVGEEALLEDEDTTGKRFKRRMDGAFAVYVYAENADVCAWYYRVARRILNVGIPYLIERGLEEPTVRGNDVMPGPMYNPDIVYVRQVTLTVQYEEEFTDQDALWTAVNGVAENFLTADGELRVAHEDADVDEDGDPDGGIGFYEE